MSSSPFPLNPVNVGQSTRMLGLENIDSLATQNDFSPDFHLHQFLATLDQNSKIKIGKGKNQVKLAPLDEVIKGFEYLLSDHTPMPFRLDLITALLQNAFYMVQAVHNELSIDYSDTNVYQAVNDVLEKAPFSITP